ncbi:(2Fe-2S)-binding protein [Sediminispirochaeta bajacaliforniensis]|uniref:(2Fe-2S)-binding protein n=1 Tax=Sediminispirochaeta bajacaliforniensis TaxID=148 RepID=UPI00037479FF|nr:(2Fe-2S)-binding protein [Sediminispirochaeta bajacaliforniensis]
MKRIIHHPILGEMEEKKLVTIFVDGKRIQAREGEPIAAALLSAGIDVFRHTKKGSPRSIFCGIGQCTDCSMIVDGVPNVRTCVTLVADGMIVETQEGVGVANL